MVKLINAEKNNPKKEMIEITTSDFRLYFGLRKILIRARTIIAKNKPPEIRLPVLKKLYFESNKFWLLYLVKASKNTETAEDKITTDNM